MFTRRHFAQAAAALALLPGQGRAAGRVTQESLLRFEPMGQVTLLHLTDLHAQLLPVHFREPSVNIGIGEARGKAPHLTGEAALAAFGVTANSAEAFALTSLDFTALAREYGRMGGLDRIATLVAAIRSERGEDRVLLLDGGDTWQGSWTALQTRGADMRACMKLLKPSAMVGHFEFTYGQNQILEHAQDCGFISGNILDEWKEPVLDRWKIVERGGVRVGILGQSFPYTPVANPRHFIPDWTFGIQEELVRANVAAMRAEGAEVVVLLSHNGYDVDKKLAGRVEGIDVILSGHTHDAVPVPETIGRTLLVASGCSGKFLARVDLDVKGGRVTGFRHRLIPVFADAITPDPAMAAEIAAVRAPFLPELARTIGTTETLLYRRGNLQGSFDDLICEAMLEQRDAEIALSPGFRWGPSLLPGETITAEALYACTAITYPACTRTLIRGDRLKEILEDVADNLFNPDPYYQQGGDMVRVGGIGFTLAPEARIGNRIGDLTLLRSGAAIEGGREYVVAGWASVAPAPDGPPIWAVVEAHIKHLGTVRNVSGQNVRLKGQPG